MSLNRWVFKWRLKVRMLLHSRMSAGGWSSNRKSATGQFGVYASNDEHRKSTQPRCCMGLYQFAEIPWSGCCPQLVSQ